jgi:predicted nucleotide-binding protein (sugar kinase/HSP70/actin superfamily)
MTQTTLGIQDTGRRQTVFLRPVSCMPNVVCVTGVAVYLRPVSCMPNVVCVTGLAVCLRPVSCMPNVVYKTRDEDKQPPQ